MDPNRTIVSDRGDLVRILRCALPEINVMEVDPRFIDLKDPGFDRDFVPEFDIKNPKVHRQVKELTGHVICALPPRSPSSTDSLLYHLVYALKDRPARVLHAPLHNLTPQDIRAAIEGAQDPDPWLLASMLTRRVAERIIGKCIVPPLRQQQLAYTGLLSVFYLYQIEALAHPVWQRRLLFGTCEAPEIDPYGGVLYFTKKPGTPADKFSMEELTQADAEYPDPRYRLNQILTVSNEPVGAIAADLENAYMSGLCSWPLTYGAEPYGQKPLTLNASLPREVPQILRRLPATIATEKVIRAYQHPKYLFRSHSYYPQDKTVAPINKIPDERVRVRIEEIQIKPDLSLRGLAERMTALRLNVDLGSIIKLTNNEFLTQKGDQFSLTPKGCQVLECVEQAGIDYPFLYLLLRVFEEVQADADSYDRIVREVANRTNFSFST